MRMKQAVLFFTIWMVGVNCYAGEQTGMVKQILVRASDGLVYFYLSGTEQNRANCATNTQYWIIKDENSNAGKQQLALLMEAKAANLTVYVVGDGACTRWGDGEDVNLLTVS